MNCLWCGNICPNLWTNIDVSSVKPRLYSDLLSYYLFISKACITFSHHVSQRCYWVVTILLGFDDPDNFENYCQVLCSVSLNWNLSDICLMIRLQDSVWVRYCAILLTSYQGYTLLIWHYYCWWCWLPSCVNACPFFSFISSPHTLLFPRMTLCSANS